MPVEHQNVHIKRTPRVRFKGKSQQALRVCFPGFAIQARTIAPPALPALSLSSTRRRPPHEPAASSAPCLSRRESHGGRHVMHMKLAPTEPPRTCALRNTCTSTIVCGAQQVVHDCQGGVQHIERWNCGFACKPQPRADSS